MKSLKKILSAALVSASVACSSVNAGFFANGVFTNLGNFSNFVTNAGLGTAATWMIYNPRKVCEALDTLTDGELLISEGQAKTGSLVAGGFISLKSLVDSLSYNESRSKDEKIEDQNNVINRQQAVISNQYNGIGQLQAKCAQLNYACNQLCNENAQLKDTNAKLNNALLAEDVE